MPVNTRFRAGGAAAFLYLSRQEGDDICLEVRDTGVASPRKAPEANSQKPRSFRARLLCPDSCLLSEYYIRMSELARIGVAIDSDLLEKFDELIGKRGYTNRSEAFRDLIRDELVQKSWESPESHVVGTVTLVYDHHIRMLTEK